MSTSSAQAREREREVGASYDDEFVALVRARKEATEEETRKRWNEGAATPRVAYDLGQDYIRRVSVAYPYAVVGSARGDVAVCDVVDASALAVSPAAHKKDWSDVDARPLGERVLLGAHDGGAVTAVAITKDAPKQEKHDFAHVASGGRDGVVRLYKACKNSAALHELGCANHDDVVTGVTFARGSLWSVALDGRLCRWSLATSHAKGKSAKHAKESLIDADEYVREQAPALTKEGEWRSGQPTLCLNACESSGFDFNRKRRWIRCVAERGSESYDFRRNSRRKRLDCSRRLHRPRYRARPEREHRSHWWWRRRDPRVVLGLSLIHI